MSRPLRVLVVGAGANIWKAHARGLEAIDAQVVGVHDRDQDRAAQAARLLGCPAAPDLSALLATEADLAVVLTPHPSHAEVAVRCLRAGLHVLVEKPLAVSVAEADRMVAEAERSGRLLAVALQHRTRREVREARRLIQEGELGQLQRADLLATWPRRASYFQTAPWRGTWEGEGGGILINQGQHDLDLLCHLAGLPRRVVGRTRNWMHSIQTEDTASALLEWDNGASGAILLSTALVDEPQRLEISGTRGRLRLLPGRLEVWRHDVDFREYAASAGNPFETPGTEASRFDQSGGGEHRDIYVNLVEAIDNRAPLVAPARDAARTLELANSIIYSSMLAREVTLPLGREAYTALIEQLKAGALPSGLGRRAAPAS
ncbi:MAG: Gfo/Idh/MocA family oxidoreductase [Chloroflexota bacterium]|nr:Gfo/Idh/MocA family oxidoreductase [Chloroflexota bacterium]